MKKKSNISRGQSTEEMLDMIIKLNEQFNSSFVWNNFVDEIKNRNRFFPSKKFQEYIKMLLDLNITTSYNTEFYRARLIKPYQYVNMHITKTDEANNRSGIYGLSREEMHAPPSEVVDDGRANPKGISYLYLANDPQTACSELRPTVTDSISISKFILEKNLNIISLNNINLEKYNEPEKTKIFHFLKNVFSSFTMPTNEQNSVVYAPSQYIAAYLQSNSIDGIQYASSSNMQIKSFNLVLFNPKNAKCVDEYGEVYRCIEKHSVFQNISVLNEKILKAKSSLTVLNREDIIVKKQEIETYILKNKEKG